MRKLAAPPGESRRIIGYVVYSKPISLFVPLFEKTASSPKEVGIRLSVGKQAAHIEMPLGFGLAIA